MGYATDLHCDACGYAIEYMVHGFDCGDVGCVQAVTCTDCRALRVAPLPETMSFPFMPGARLDFSGVQLRCPESDAHHVAPWYYPGPCPRCGVALRRGARFVIWD
jgi:hypothetical protein